MPFLTIKRETDIVALAAFVLAVAAVIYQVSAYFRGARVTLFGPEQMLIHGDQYPGGETYVRFAARMSYLNSGDIGYNAVVGREFLRVQVSNTAYTQAWEYFIQSNSTDGKTLSLGDQKEAVPTPINGGDSKTHETYFAPWPIDCKGASDCKPDANFMLWETFLNSIKSGGVLTFQMTADIYGEKEQTVTCTVDVTAALLDQLRTTPNKWGAPPCREALSSH